MANSLSSLASVGFRAVQALRAEIIGLIAACTTDYSLDAIPLNEDVLVPIVGAAGPNTDVVAGLDAGKGSDTIVTTIPIRISKIRKNTFYLKGEDMTLINRIGFAKWFGIRLTQSMRTLVNEIESELAIEAMNNAGFAVGVGGTPLFGTDHSILNAAYRIFVENGVPMDDLSAIMLPTYTEKLRNLNYLFKVNEGGDNGELLRQGILGKLSSFNIRESAYIKTHTKGTVSTVTTTGAAAGALVLPVSGGAFAQGDLVSVAGITDRKYIASGPVAPNGNLSLNSELYKEAVAGSAVNVEAADHVANIMLHRRGLVLALRVPVLPPGGDKAEETFVYGDSRSGLSFQVARYGQYLQSSYEVRIAYGKKVVEPAVIGILAA